MAGSLGSDHGNVYVLRRNNASEMDIKAVSEHQHVALFQVRLDIFLIEFSLLLIIDQDHDNVSLFCSLCRRIYFESLFFRSLPGSASLI